MATDFGRGDERKQNHNKLRQRSPSVTVLVFPVAASIARLLKAGGVGFEPQTPRRRRGLPTHSSVTGRPPKLPVRTTTARRNVTTVSCHPATRFLHLEGRGGEGCSCMVGYGSFLIIIISIITTTLLSRLSVAPPPPAPKGSTSREQKPGGSSSVRARQSSWGKQAMSPLDT